MPDSLNQQKFNFLKKVYFGVSDNYLDDINPFTDIVVFGNSPVGQLRWGFDPEARQRSKLRFAYNYHNVLKNFKIYLSVEDIFSFLIDADINDRVINKWVQIAIFPNP